MANVETGWLKNDTGEKFAPKTFPSQVIMRDGKTLEDTDIAYIDETDSDFIEDVEEENTDSSTTSNTILVPVEASGFVLNETTGRYEQTVSVVGMTEGNGGIWDIVRSGSVLTEEEAEIVANITDVERLVNSIKITCLKVPAQTYTLVLYGTFVESGETLISSMPAWFNRVETLESRIGNADISGIGDWTVTGAIKDLDTSVSALNSKILTGTVSFEANTIIPGALLEKYITFSRQFKTSPNVFVFQQNSYANIEPFVKSPDSGGFGLQLWSTRSETIQEEITYAWLAVEKD